MRSSQAIVLGLAAVLLTAIPSRAEPPRPKLRVELKMSPEPISMGSEARFTITLHNDGPGSINDVVVRATLSQGFDHEQGRDLEQSLRRVKAGERVVLDALRTRAVAAGDQSCSVVVTGVGSEEVRSKKELKVARQ